VKVPPLRDRLDDVGPLALHFIEEICRELGREPMLITQSQVSLLKRQPWPGNIRELKNVIERAVISTTGNRLRLDLALPAATARTAQTTESALPEPSEFVTAEEFKLLEKANITAALAHSNWIVWGPDGAAELLGMRPSTLSYQMKALGIVKDRSAD
jgi:transcriptional regulator with GAF, ATPase, and Fis domain